MSDLIDRQAAISAICNACGKIDCDKMDKCEKLQLPPANSSEFPNNSDTISRQDAIDALDKRFDNVPMEQTTEILLLRKDLRELPSAQPEPLKIDLSGYSEEDWERFRKEWANVPIMALPKRGRWERHYSRPNVYADLFWHCSACGYKSSDGWANKFNFCPNCGADMRGERDG